MVFQSPKVQYFGAETLYMDFDRSNDLVADQSPEFDTDV